MATFTVKNAGLSIDADNFTNCAGEVSKVQSELEEIRSHIGGSLSKSSGIGKMLKQESQNIYREFDSIETLSSTLKKISVEYDSAEIKIVQSTSASAKLKNIVGTGWNLAEEYYDKGKIKLDALGKLGTTGKIFSFPISLLKWMLDGAPDIFHDPKSHIDILKGIVGTAEGVSDFGEKLNDYLKHDGTIDYETLKNKFLGTDVYSGIVMDSTAAGWAGKLANAKASFSKSLEKGIGIKDEAGKVQGFKIAGWALSFVSNGISNYDEYKSTPGMTRSRAAAETVTETLIDIGKGAVLSAGVAAASAALGVAAPAVAVGVGAMAASKVLDVACTHLTGKSVTEAVSDLYLDTVEKVAKAKVNAAKNVAKSVSNWIGKVAKSVQNTSPQVAIA